MLFTMKDMKDMKESTLRREVIDVGGVMSTVPRCSDNPAACLLYLYGYNR